MVSITIMKSLLIVFGTLLLIIATPFVFIAIDDTITQSATESFAGVSTGAGTYTANITLGRSIYNNDTTSITELASNLTVDTPSASTYNQTSRILNVSGLEQSLTRTLTLVFLIDTTTLPDGAIVFITLLRWFWVFIIVGMAAGAIYAFFHT